MIRSSRCITDIDTENNCIELNVV